MERNALIGIKEITLYLNCSKNLFYKLVECGLPVYKLAGTWCAHKKQLDEFFISPDFQTDGKQ